MKFELKTRQICLFLIAIIPINKLFIMPSILAKSAGEDMWISCLISLAIDFLTILSVVLVRKRTNETFFTLLKNCFGNFGAKIIFFLFFIYFMVKAIIPINEQKEYVELTLYTLKPSIFYFLPFFIAAFYFCTKSLRVIGRAADVVWAFTVIGFITLLSLSLSNADFTALLPVGAHGLNNILSGTSKSFNWFGDAAYLLFFVGEFEYRKKDGLKIIFSYLLGAVMVMIFIIVFYSIFTSIAHRQRFALTEIAKYTTVINNIGRFDYIGIILLMFSNFFSISAPLFFACKVLNKIFDFKKNWISPLVVISIQAAVIIFLPRYYASIENLMQTHAAIYFFILGNLLPALTPLLTIRRKTYASA